MRTTVFERALETAAKTIVVREKDSFQVDLRVHVVSQDAVNKDHKRITKIRNWLISCKLDIRPNQSSMIWGRKEHSTSSAKHQGAQSKN